MNDEIIQSPSFQSFTGGPGQTGQNVTAAAGKYPPAHNLFPPGQLFDLHMYLDESVRTFFTVFTCKLSGKLKNKILFSDTSCLDWGSKSKRHYCTFTTPEVDEGWKNIRPNFTQKSLFGVLITILTFVLGFRPITYYGRYCRLRLSRSWSPILPNPLALLLWDGTRVWSPFLILWWRMISSGKYGWL